MTTYRKLLGTAVLAGACAVLPAVGHAQPASEEITVEGRYGRVPDSTQSLSQAVSYADLDLSTAAGRDILRRRVALTARYLCGKLGESDTASGPVLPSCRDSAAKDAMRRIGTIEEGFAPRGSTWVAGPAWAAPYPEDWWQRYP